MAKFRPIGEEFTTVSGETLVAKRMYHGCTGCYFLEDRKCTKPCHTAECIASARMDNTPVIYLLKGFVNKSHNGGINSDAPYSMTDFVHIIMNDEVNTRAFREGAALSSIGRTTLQNNFESIWIHSLAKYTSACEEKRMALFFASDKVKQAYSKKYVMDKPGFRYAIEECLKGKEYATKEIMNFSAVFNLKKATAEKKQDGEVK